MRLLPFIILFLLAAAVPLLHAADEAPPSLPTGGGVLFGSAIFSNGSKAANMPMVILVRSNSSETIYRLITDSGGKFVLSSGTGKYEVDALLSDEANSILDNAATGQVDTSKEENITLVFYPAGSITGTVELEGSPVAGASVKVACPSSGFDYARINGGATVQAGEAGDFIFKALPAGTCQFSASTDSLAGTSSAQVQYEKTVTVKVAMEKKAVQNDLLPYALGIIAVALIAYAAFQLLQRGKTKKEQPIEPAWRPSMPVQKKKSARQKEDDEDGGMASKLSDPKVKAVIATLSDRESEIVRFLFKSNGRAKRSQLQHKLLIPKTSLLRNLRSLERKRIVKLTPFGRNLLAEIDDWLNK